MIEQGMLLLTLAWRPFLDPIPVGSGWLWLALPLILAISVVYKALKHDDMRAVPLAAARLTGIVVLFLVVAAVLLYLLTEWL